MVNSTTLTAKGLVESMIKVNLIPDIVTFNQIIKALCEMRLVGDATVLVIPVEPIRNPMITFTTLLRDYDVGDMKMAYKILKYDRTWIQLIRGRGL